VTGADRLARHYRRLLWAYPRRYRRERGAELVTTLLDDATPGQLRPTVAEARDLVAGGLRARLRPPRHPFARLVAAQVALYAGVLGAAAGVLLSGYPGPPDGAAAVAAATIAVPERPLARPGPPVACDMICPGPAGDGAAAYRRPWDHTDTVLIRYRVPAGQLSTVVTQARERLAAAGWRVTAPHVQNDGVVWFGASDGRLDLAVTGAGEGEAVSIVASKAASGRAVALLLTGGSAGALGGWLVAAWALHRFRRHRAARRWALAVAAAPYLVFGTLASLAAAGFTAASAGLLDRGAASVKVPLLVLPDPTTAYWAGPALVASSGLLALVLAALPGPALPGPARPPAAARRVPAG